MHRQRLVVEKQQPPTAHPFLTYPKFKIAPLRKLTGLTPASEGARFIRATPLGVKPFMTFIVYIFGFMPSLANLILIHFLYDAD